MNELIMPINGYVLLYFGLAFVVASCLIYIFFLLVKKRQQQIQMNFLQSIIEEFRPTLGIEKNLDFLLSRVQEIVEAPNYSFYMYNFSNGNYILKAVRQATNDTQIAPSYSGLVPYEKEQFDPPLSLPKESMTEKTVIIKEGEVPLLTIPIKGGKGFIRIGPVKTVQRKVKKNLDRLGDVLEIPILNLMEEEDQRRNYEVLETSSKAVRMINRIFVHEVEYLKFLIQTFVKTLHPLSCMLLQSNSAFGRVSYSFNMSKHVVQNINENLQIAVKIREIMSDKSFAVISSSNICYEKLKELLKINMGDYVVILQFSLFEKMYTLFFSFEQGSKEVEDTRSQQVKMIWNHIQQLIKVKHVSKQVSVSYIELLKSLADMIDQMSPYTIGYSKMMSSYSMAIAKQLGLNPFQIRNVGLAAYLSNVGIIGLSDGILNKDGKYSDEEFEQMKLHSEVGAVIIENTIAQDEVALYVRYHHERMDGNGYPSRLRGEDIPIGARIIAVVQTFLAKINGRAYREPLLFDDALRLLQNAAGTQLDTKIVFTFIQWYEQKRIQRNGINKALGYCWELNCTSSSICSKCPSYENKENNCWENERNNCLAHGKTCKTCFVYTEAMSRFGRFKEIVK